MPIVGVAVESSTLSGEAGATMTATTGTTMTATATATRRHEQPATRQGQEGSQYGYLAASKEHHFLLIRKYCRLT